MRVIAFAVAVCFCSYRRCYTHAKAFSLFNHCSFSESKYNYKSCGKGQARSCNRPDDKQCFFVKNGGGGQKWAKIINFDSKIFKKKTFLDLFFTLQ
jgi:hypothetical protein